MPEMNTKTVLHHIRTIVLIVLTLTSVSAHAYVGPGLGLGVIGTIIGGILAIFLAVAGVVWYPVKRLLKKRKAAGNSVVESDQDAPQKEGSAENEQSNET